jgi:hypothetical protein
MGYKLINERICVLGIRGRSFNTTYKSIHAPTEEKDTFYENLEQKIYIYIQTLNKEIKIIIGDFNTKISKEQ